MYANAAGLDYWASAESGRCAGQLSPACSSSIWNAHRRAILAMILLIPSCEDSEGAISTARVLHPERQSMVIAEPAPTSPGFQHYGWRRPYRSQMMVDGEAEINIARPASLNATATERPGAAAK
jgi:hypothetical protein